MVTRSGQITVTTATTEVQGPDSGPGTYLLKAKPTNTGVVYVGNDGAGAVASTTGYPLSASESLVVVVGSLNELWFDATVNGSVCCWYKLDNASQ
jgi:hypothetical protein